MEKPLKKDKQDVNQMTWKERLTFAKNESRDITLKAHFLSTGPGRNL